VLHVGGVGECVRLIWEWMDRVCKGLSIPRNQGIYNKGCQNCARIHLAPIKRPYNTLRTTWSNMHKVAVHLCNAEKQKPNGMSIRKVISAILAKFEVCPSRTTIARYAKHGLMNASPMKMCPAGLLPAMTYKFLCQAYLSLIQINQMNACAGDNSRKEMIPSSQKRSTLEQLRRLGF